MNAPLVVALIGCLTGTATAQQVATRASAAEAALARSLVHDARPGYLPSRDVRAYIHRALVLGRLAQRLDPTNPQVYQVQAEPLRAAGQFDQAAQAEMGYLRALEYRDYAAFVRLLGFRLEGLHTAEQRSQFLRDAADDGRYTHPQRAMALANLAALREAQAQPEQAMGLYRQALQLDAHNPTAIQRILHLSSADVLPLPGRVELLLSMLCGDPLSSQTAWVIADQCRHLGLEQPALTMYRHALRALELAAQPPPSALEAGYLEALLDAGQARQAVERFAPRLVREPLDVELATRMIEAYRMLDEAEPAEALAQRLARVYEPAAPTARAHEAAAMAWVNYRYLDRLPTARTWAQRAMDQAPDNPVVQRIWAVVMLEGPRRDEAVRQLQALAPTDPYAAAPLVEHFLRVGQAEQARRVLAALKNHSRTGPAWRALRSVVRGHGLALPDPPPEAQPIAAAVAKFRDGCHRMVLNPEQFISVSLEPVAARVRPGDEPAVRVTLHNTGDLPLPLGEHGMLTPRLMLLVEATDPAGNPVRQSVPADLAAPRYLGPGQALIGQFRLDHGAVQDLLMRNPLLPIELRVSGVLEPLQVRGEYVSAFQAPIAIATATVRREALISQDTPEAYHDALAELVRGFTGDEPVRAMRAAEATVSLLVMLQQADAGRVRLPAAVAANPRRAEVLAMLRYCIRQAPPPVQARTLGAMRALRLSDIIVELLSPALQSPEPLVRARAIELLGLSDATRHAPIIEHLAANDPDELVRQMAQAFARPLRGGTVEQ